MVDMTSDEVMTKAVNLRAEMARKRVPLRTAAAGLDDVRVAISAGEPIVATRGFKANGTVYNAGDIFPAEEMTGNIQVLAERRFIASQKAAQAEKEYRALQALVREMSEPESILNGAITTRRRAEQALALARMAVTACSNDLDTALNHEQKAAQNLSVVLGDTP